MKNNTIRAVVAAAAVAVAGVASATDYHKETIDGYTWSYSLLDAGAYIDSGVASTPAVNPKPELTVTIPAKLGGKKVVEIGGSAFVGCDEMTGVVIPSTVKRINSGSFKNCSELRSVKLPDGLGYIGERCFEGCTKLECVEFGKTASKGKINIDGYAFKGCDNLDALVFKGNDQTDCAKSAFSGVSCKVYVPKSKNNWPADGELWNGLVVVRGDRTVDVKAKPQKDGAGTVQGAGVYAIGKTVSLKAKATPKSNWVFCGWRDAVTGEFLTYSTTYKYTVAGCRASFTALFSDSDKDAETFSVEQHDFETAEDGTVCEPVDAFSRSEPKLTFKGLPSGVKYNASKRVLEGKATKPGIYEVTVSGTNKSVKKAKTSTFTIIVPNKTCPALPNLYPDVGAYGVLHCGVNFSEGRIDCEPLEGWSVKVSGLPSGLKYKDGEISGVPTKAGHYTVTFTATKKGEKKQTATITLSVYALDEWAVGTFNGGNIQQGSQTPGQWMVTITGKGKITGKYIGNYKGQMMVWTFSAANIATYSRKENKYYVDLAANRNGTPDGVVKMTIAPGKSTEGGDGYVIDGKRYGVLRDGGIWHAYQQVDWKSDPWKTLSTKIGKAKAELPLVRDIYEDSVRKGTLDMVLKFSAAGGLTVKSQYTNRATGQAYSQDTTSATLTPTSAPDENGAFSGVVNLYVMPKVDFDGFYEQLRVRWTGTEFVLE